MNLSILFSKSINYVKIPFGLKNKNNIEPKNTLLEKKFNNIAYINLTIGTPAQNVPLTLRIDSLIFYISSKTFNKTKSNTFESTADYGMNFDYEYVGSDYITTIFFI